MNRNLRRFARSAVTSPVAFSALLVACGGVAGCSSDFSGGPMLPDDVPVVDGSTPPPPATADGAVMADAPSSTPPDAPSPADAGGAEDAGDAAPARDAGADAPVEEDAAPAVDAGVDAAPPPPVDAGTDAPLSCAPGTADCDGNPQNGCETNLGTDPQHCGSCQNDCDTLPHVSGAASCSSGTCSVPPSACQAGYAHCSANPESGCETDLSQPGTCGSCTTSCTGGTPVCSPNGSGGFACSSGCPGSAPTLCGSTCTDTTSDPNHCGGCSEACSAVADGTPTCAASTCGFTCDTSYHACGSACLSDTSVSSCGASCTPCPSGPANSTATCGGSPLGCGFTCNSGTHQCGTGASAACDDDTSAESCGTSCTPCPGLGASNAIVTCSAAEQCTFACDSGYHQCGSAGAPTCEDSSSVNSCGGRCDDPCPVPPHTAAAACNSGGACVYTTCLAGYADCDGNAANGCEVDLATDAKNCGACGNSCAIGALDGSVVGTCGPNTAGATVCAPATVLDTTISSVASPLVLDSDGSLVFAAGNEIFRVTNAGGTFTKTEITSTANASDIVGGLVADASNYYFTYASPTPADAGLSVGGVASHAKTAGGSPASLYSGEGFFGLALGGSTLYVSDYTSAARAIPLPSGAATPSPSYCSGNIHTGLECDANIFAVAADANGAFFGTSPFGPAIVSWKATGTTPGSPAVDIAANFPTAKDTGASAAAADPFDIELDADNLYWADSQSNIMQAPRAGGSPVVVATVPGSAAVAVKLAVAGGYVYWTTGTGTNGTVVRAPIGGDGGTYPTPLAAGESATVGQPWGIAVVPATKNGSTTVTPAYVYWTTLSGNLRGVAVWQ